MKNGGYTLVEILVVVGIVTILSGVALGYNRVSNTQLSLFKTESLLIGYLNRAKTLSQQRLNIEGVCAFGVHFASSSFFVFGDKIEDPLTNRQCRTSDGAYTGSGVYEETDYLADNRIVLDSSITLNPQIDNIDILFLPPDLSVTTTFRGADGASLPIDIVISGPGGSKTVTLESGGQISSQ